MIQIQGHSRDVPITCFRYKARVWMWFVINTFWGMDLTVRNQRVPRSTALISKQPISIWIPFYLMGCGLGLMLALVSPFLESYISRFSSYIYIFRQHLSSVDPSSKSGNMNFEDYLKKFTRNLWNGTLLGCVQHWYNKNQRAK